MKKAIAKGIHEGFFGYYSGSTPTVDGEGTYQVPVTRVRFNTTVGEDNEIDLESGFLMTPEAIPIMSSSPPANEEATTQEMPGCGPSLILTSPGIDHSCASPPGSSPQTSVEINFSADRSQLFSAWIAIANLADLAGKVKITVRAESAEGFDKGKLQNGVLEPLRESDLIE